MYGLINQGIEDLIVENHGQEKWQEIKAAACIDVENFIGMNIYPDSDTYKLVEAASQILNATQDQLFEAFGEFWILYTGKKGYGHLLEMGGDNFIDFFQNLNQLHGHIQAMMPELKPPKFWCTDITNNSITIHYKSDRSGLSHLVIGLIRGVGKKFEISIEVEHKKSKASGDDHDEFVVTL